MEQQEILNSERMNQIEKILSHSKIELATIQCPDHGYALKGFGMDEETGVIKVETCCESGEKLINKIVNKIS